MNDFYILKTCMQAFVHLMDAVKSSDTSEKMPELEFSAKRVVYRFSS